MNGWMDGLANECIDRQMDELTDRLVERICYLVCALQIQSVKPLPDFVIEGSSTSKNTEF